MSGAKIAKIIISEMLVSFFLIKKIFYIFRKANSQLYNKDSESRLKNPDSKTVINPINFKSMYLLSWLFELKFNPEFYKWRHTKQSFKINGLSITDFQANQKIIQ